MKKYYLITLSLCETKESESHEKNDIIIINNQTVMTTNLKIFMRFTNYLKFSS
jgi:hypothetical protein